METIYYHNIKFVDDVESIYRWCKYKNFFPDTIIGVARGGLVPAVYLAHKFDVPMISLNWSTRDFINRDTVVWNNIVINSVAGKRFLLIDDIVDSGVTMRELFSATNGYTQDELLNIKTITLWYNNAQHWFTPDYHSNTINRNFDKRWVIFPWEE